MAEIFIMGAGLGGAVMAYEMKDKMRPQDKLTVVTKDPIYHFVPSNPWVAVGWRSRQSVEVDLALEVDDGDLARLDSRVQHRLRPLV